METAINEVFRRVMKTTEAKVRTEEIYWFFTLVIMMVPDLNRDNVHLAILEAE